jgi:antirestriction protein
MSMQECPRIYVASLSDYNAGRLHGKWIDLDDTTTADDIRESIQEMLTESPEPVAEEWAIHDYEAMPNLGEWPDLEHVAKLAAGIAEHGAPFSAWVELYNYVGFDFDDFQNQYVGEYKDEEDYAYQFAEDTGLTDKLDEAGFSTSYVDWEAYASDLFMEMDSAPMPGGGIYVFSPNR